MMMMLMIVMLILIVIEASDMIMVMMMMMTLMAYLAIIISKDVSSLLAQDAAEGTAKHMWHLLILNFN